MSGTSSAMSAATIAALLTIGCSESHCDGSMDAGTVADARPDVLEDAGCDQQTVVGPIMIAVGGRLPGGDGCSVTRPGLDLTIYIFESGVLRDSRSARCEDDYVDLVRSNRDDTSSRSRPQPPGTWLERR